MGGGGKEQVECDRLCGSLCPSQGGGELNVGGGAEEKHRLKLEWSLQVRYTITSDQFYLLGMGNVPKGLACGWF